MRLIPVRFTIERLRTMVLAAGILLIAAVVVFLAMGRIKSRFNARELPKRLGINIEQEANGVTYSHALGAHAQFKVHASKAEQLKNGQILLHNVVIELYGQDGAQVDRIEGNEFNYDQNKGTATAAGPVEITLSQPAVAPAIAPKAAPGRMGGKVTKPLATAAFTAASGEIHVQTSGLASNWNTGVTTTDQRVDFKLKQGAGSSMGASYDSQHGILILEHDVELTTERAGDAVHIRAQHAEFTRDESTCRLRSATANYRGGQATAAEAKVLFREDGSAVRLDASGGFVATTATGSRLSAPIGAMEFDEHNQPRHGHLEGGMRIDSVTADRQIHGTAPTAELEFTAQGELRHAHLEQGVHFTSDAVSKNAGARATVRTSRTWTSQIADVVFRSTQRAREGHIEPASIHGVGGVVLTGLTQRGNAAPAPSRLAADEVDGTFGPGSALTSMRGQGHTALSQTTAAGANQTASGDRVEAHFASGSRAGMGTATGEAEQIESAVLDGHVVLVDEPAPKPAPSSGAAAEAPMRASAGKAVYEGTGQWLHLTESPRVDNGAVEMTANKIDISQQSGDAFAHGDVKATWLDQSSLNQSNSTQGRVRPPAAQQSISLGGQGPAHAVAQEAQLNRKTNEATFKGHARLWQQDNSIAAPVIVLNGDKKTLAAQSTNRTEPVRVVLLTAEGLAPRPASVNGSGAKTPNPSVIRVHGGDLLYSDVARKALMVGGALGPVVAETSSASSVSDQVELYLLPASAHPASGQGQVDRMIATGHVVVNSQDRRGTGDQLIYTSNTGNYVLTGSAAVPPKIVDPERGTVVGAALIFNSRDDSVSIEGGGHETRTDTTVSQTKGKSEPQK